MATASNTNNTSSSILLAEPLDKLPVHLNTVLIQIGKLFRHQAVPEQRALGLQKTQAHDVISKTTRKYHEALDEIEIEILSARAVLERDLNAIKAKQAQRENVQIDATKNLTPEDDVLVEDIPMHNSEENAIKIQSPEPNTNSLAEISEDHLLTDSATVPNETQEEGITEQPAEESKEIDLDDDLFGDAIADDFGPVDIFTNESSENANFDLFNSTTGGDFDMDFSVEPNIPTTTSSQAVPTSNATADAVNPEVSVDNDLLMQSFADISATGNTESNDFGDLDFDAIDHTQGDANGGDNPFGDHSNVEFDDFFNN